MEDIAPISQRLASAIRWRRIKLRLSQKELAERAGLCRPQVSNMESGKYGTLLSTAEKVAQALGCSLGDLVDPNGAGGKTSRSA